MSFTNPMATWSETNQELITAKDLSDYAQNNKIFYTEAGIYRMSGFAFVQKFRTDPNWFGVGGTITLKILPGQVAYVRSYTVSYNGDNPAFCLRASIDPCIFEPDTDDAYVYDTVLSPGDSPYTGATQNFNASESDLSDPLYANTTALPVYLRVDAYVTPGADTFYNVTSGTINFLVAIAIYDV